MSSFNLKMIALLLMLIDHIGMFIPNMPLWFRIVGRLSAPIFIFCSLWSFVYTRNKKRYIARLYIASLFMSIIQYYLHIDNNFFRTLFSICIILYLIELFQNKNKSFKKYLIIYLVWQSVSVYVNILLFNTELSFDLVSYIIPALLGSFFLVGGGFAIVFLGVILYLSKDNKKIFSIVFIIFDLIYLLSTATPIIFSFLRRIEYWGFKNLYEIFCSLAYIIIGQEPMFLGGSMWTVQIQWMMIFSLPFMLMYNHKKGRGLKWLFYIFYPTHIILLFYLGQHMS